jgi:hypothetical protein
MSTGALALMLVSAFEVAVMVTVVADTRLAGAMKLVMRFVGALNDAEPQYEAGVQLHVIPWLEVSPLIAAWIGFGVLAPVNIAGGGLWANETVIATVIAILALALALLSATEVAVTVTLPATEGAVYRT